MISKKEISETLERVKQYAITSYPGDKKVIEKIIDVNYARCKLADRDHWKSSRVYSHIGCEDLQICISSSIELLSTENLQGIFLHELGHIIHIQLPEIIENVMDDEEIDFINEADDDEVIADYVVDNLFQIHIYYDENKVQWAEI